MSFGFHRRASMAFALLMGLVFAIVVGSFRSASAQFVDATSSPLDHAGQGAGVAWGDYDNDGDLDLYLANVGPNKLFRNDGGGSFADATTSVLGDSGFGYGVAWGDYDNDGDLDLYLANSSGPNRLFRNDGGGTWVDVAAGTPLEDSGRGRGVAWGDYDNDGDLDLYLTNNGEANKLFRNDGGGMWVDVSVGTPLADAGWGMSVAWGDYDNDGDLDLYLTNNGEANKLFRKDGDDTWVDVAAGTALADAGIGVSVVWGDYDNDGDLDLYLVNHGTANKLFRNDGDAAWVDVAAGTLLATTERSAGVAWGDYDNDGDLDLYLANENTANQLFRNEAATGQHWLQVQLHGTASNRASIGARVRLVVGGTSQIREISGGSGFMSQDAMVASFGMGSATVVDSLIVRWPSGVVQVVDPVPAVDGVATVFEPGFSGVLYVDTDAIGTGDGRSWADAYPELRDALATAKIYPMVTEIWVAEGIYTPTDGTDRTQTFALRTGLAIYGGFAGTEATVSERDWKLHPTILSGDIGTTEYLNDNSYHVVTANGTDKTAVLDGFIVTNGRADGSGDDADGGGMRCAAADPIVMNVEFTSNTAGEGGGLYAEGGGSPRLINVKFSKNIAEYNGGGVCCTGSELSLLNVVFHNNETRGKDGGGLFAYNGSDVTMSGVTMCRNTSARYGGGMFIGGGSSASVVNSVFWGDASSLGKIPEIYDGDGGSSAVFSYSLIEGSQQGGVWLAEIGVDGGHNLDADPLFVSANAGDLRLQIGSPAIDAGSNADPFLFDPDLDGNPRISGGTVDMGAYEFDVSGATEPGTDVEVIPQDETTGDTPVTLVFDSVIEAGQTTLTTADNGPKPPNAFKLGTPPVYYEIETTAVFEGWVTVCINFGDQFNNEDNLRLFHREYDENNNLVWVDRTVSVDPESNTACARVESLSPFIVAGCNPVMYVDETAVGLGTGDSWPDAFTSLADAMASTSAWPCAVEEIWVARGSYTPTTTADRTVSFQMQNGIAWYGGFTGGETLREQRDWKANETILSGDIGIVGLISDNSYHVVHAGGTDATAVLDGFTVTGGFADGASLDGLGAGLMNGNGQPQIRNVTFVENTALSNGGGMFVSALGHPVLTNVRFLDNTANGGGGIFVGVSSATMMNVLFSGNTAVTGGGLYCYQIDDLVITNATFSGNVATSFAGGMYCASTSLPLITNTIVWSNSAPIYPEIYNTPDATPSISHSLIQGCGGSGGGWDAAMGTDLGNNLDADPWFRQPDAGDFRIFSPSPAIEAGDDSVVPVEVTSDLAGDPRTYGLHVDLGAYEYQGEATGVEDQSGRPALRRVGLRAVYPNPFNPSITIEYDIDVPRHTRLTVYDVRGRLVRRLVDEGRKPGTYQLRWQGLSEEGKQVATGVYFVRFEAGDETDVRRIVLLK